MFKNICVHLRNLRLPPRGFGRVLFSLSHQMPRHLVIGKIEARYWTAISTYRGSKIRVISVRASRDNEKQIYNESLSKK